MQVQRTQPSWDSAEGWLMNGTSVNGQDHHFLGRQAAQG